MERQRRRKAPSPTALTPKERAIRAVLAVRSGLFAEVSEGLVAVARADDGTETFDEANGVVINADGVGHGGEDDSPFPLLVPRRSRRKTAGSRQSLQFGR